MSNNPPLGEVEALRDRLSRLSEASLRINQSLDLDTVLEGVLDSARSLTDSRYGVITLLDDSGAIGDFLASGMSAEESRRLWESTNGPRFFEYLRELREPIRLSDVEFFAKSLGVAGLDLPVVARAFISAPIIHGDELIGYIFLAHTQEGEEFTREDEDILVMFASQVALVISNARRHQAEQRARADLEALVNTAPVGCVVFDTKTGEVVSINQEARRIVGDLRVKDKSVLHLLEVVTVRRADGREWSLQELPVAQVLNSGETIRAEEIVIQVPDGRKITTLINATPIWSPEGEVVSVVVTMQDMTPVEELQRLRADFLGMVSHELRTPLTTIKGSSATVLGSTSPLDPAEVRQFFEIIDQQADHMRDLINGLLDVSRIASGMLSMTPEPLDLGTLLDQAKADFLSQGARNIIDIERDPALPHVMADKQRLLQVLANLFSNASKHSPDWSTISVEAERTNSHLTVCVIDQGRGISAEHLPSLFRRFSRINTDDNGVSGMSAGLGLAICKGIVEAQGGRIWATSEGLGLGSRFIFTIPIADGTSARTAVGSGQMYRAQRRGGEQPRVLAVDDDLQTLKYVKETLMEAGYAPIVTGDPREVGHLIGVHNPHLILLDLMLPDTDGIEMMRTIPELADVPVIFLSAYGEDKIIEKALEAGAVDYIVKPFSPTELTVRIRAALNPRKASADTELLDPFQVGDLTINYLERLVTVAGRPVQLTATEYQLLAELSVNAGRALSHQQLLDRVWGADHTGDARVIRSFVKTLRRKLGDAATQSAYILTERGYGYRMPKPGPIG